MAFNGVLISLTLLHPGGVAEDLLLRLIAVRRRPRARQLLLLLWQLLALEQVEDEDWWLFERRAVRAADLNFLEAFLLRSAARVRRAENLATGELLERVRVLRQ